MRSLVKKPKVRIYHLAHLIHNGGEMVSPLCAKVPTAINLDRAYWTLREEAVTCKKCLAAIAARKKEPVTVG